MNTSKAATAVAAAAAGAAGCLVEQSEMQLSNCGGFKIQLWLAGAVSAQPRTVRL